MILTLLRLLSIGIAFALIARWLHRRKQPRDQSTGSFDEAVKDPNLWDSMNEHFQQRDRELENAKHWSDTEIGLALEQYVFKLKHSDNDTDEWLLKLAQQPAKASQQALATLHNHDLQSRLRKEPHGQPSLYRACQVLMLAPSPQAAPSIQRLLSANNKDVRIEALRWLAQVADATHVDDLLNGFRSDDEGARGAVLNGLHDGKHTPKSRLTIDMFEPVAGLLSQNECKDNERAAQLLLQWDRDSALSRLKQLGVFNPSHNAFRDTLKAMLAEGELLPRQQLHELWQALASHGPSLSAANPVLQMLAEHRNDDDLPLLRQILEREHESAAAAANALLHYHGLQDWVETVSQRPEALRSEAERAAMAVFNYDCDVCNGGHTQFFFNSSGGSWQTALTALENAPDTARLEILREAIAQFPEPPSSNRETRHEQLSRITTEAANTLEELDTRYYAVKHPAAVTITRLVLATPKVFRA